MKKFIVLGVLFFAVSVLAAGCTERYVMQEKTVVETREVVE